MGNVYPCSHGIHPHYCEEQIAAARARIAEVSASLTHDIGESAQKSTAKPCTCRGCYRVTFDPGQLCAPCSLGNHAHPDEHRCPSTDMIDKLGRYIRQHHDDLITADRDPADIAILVMGKLHTPAVYEPHLSER